jgi:hypothetical protein
MSRRAAISHGSARTIMSHLTGPWTTLPSQRFHLVPPRGIATWSQIWSPTRQTDATRQSTTSIQREAPQRVTRPMALLVRRSHIPRTSSVSAMLATRSIVSRETMGDSPSCRQDHELIRRVPGRSGIRTATACSVGFLKVPQVALPPPKARSARVVWSSLPSLHRSAVSRRVVRCNDPYITPGGIWTYLRWGGGARCKSTLAVCHRRPRTDVMRGCHVRQ